MNKGKTKDLFLRALKVFIQTFIQAFVTSFIVQFANMHFIEGKNLKNILIDIVISAGVTSISTVWKIVLSPLLKENS